MSYGDIEIDLKKLCENLWDMSFFYNGQACGIFPNSPIDLPVYIGSEEYHATSYEELINLDIEGKTFLEVLKKSTDVQYY